MTTGGRCEAVASQGEKAYRNRGITEFGALTRLRCPLRLHLRPLLLQAFWRDGDGGAKLLGEERDAVFFKHPTQVQQLGIDDRLAIADAGGAPGRVANAAGSPGTSRSRAAHRPADSPVGCKSPGNTAGIAAATPRASSKTNPTPLASRFARGCRRSRIATLYPAHAVCRLGLCHPV